MLHFVTRCYTKVQELSQGQFTDVTPLSKSTILRMVHKFGTEYSILYKVPKCEKTALMPLEGGRYPRKCACKTFILTRQWVPSLNVSRITMQRVLVVLVDSNTEAILPVAISPSNAIYHLRKKQIHLNRISHNGAMQYPISDYCFIASWYSNRRYCFSVRTHLRTHTYHISLQQEL